MKHRGVTIVRVPYNAGCRVMDREPFTAKPIIKRGFAPRGVNYPMEKQEAVDAVDWLIEQTMRCCRCDEREAVALLEKS